MKGSVLPEVKKGECHPNCLPSGGSMYTGEFWPAVHVQGCRLTPYLEEKWSGRRYAEEGRDEMTEIKPATDEEIAEFWPPWGLVSNMDGEDYCSDCNRAESILVSSGHAKDCISIMWPKIKARIEALKAENERLGKMPVRTGCDDCLDERNRLRVLNAEMLEALQIAVDSHAFAYEWRNHGRAIIVKARESK